MRNTYWAVLYTAAEGLLGNTELLTAFTSSVERFSLLQPSPSLLPLRARILAMLNYLLFPDGTKPILYRHTLAQSEPSAWNALSLLSHPLICLLKSLPFHPLWEASLTPLGRCAPLLRTCLSCLSHLKAFLPMLSASSP